MRVSEKEESMSPDWLASTNWLVADGSLEGSISFETSSAESTGGIPIGVLLERPADSPPCEITNMMKKMLKDKQKPATSEAKETIGGLGRGGNPNSFWGRENPEVEILEGDDGMSPLESLSREEMSVGYDRRGADFVGRKEDFYH
ncbi:hypothetical protein MA16_Dca010970 [Dendrobium catenatum]|uniref:Uncharacterized protein n=1 Tax=Dendrobium catenatum TaxID=906689 RepID=A0A2I0WVQ9_9ASPA|nr:hypothetical protein MA16_Dca010970 [Dendrobium catenatum]